MRGSGAVCIGEGVWQCVRLAGFNRMRSLPRAGWLPWQLWRPAATLWEQHARCSAKSPQRRRMRSAAEPQPTPHQFPPHLSHRTPLTPPHPIPPHPHRLTPTPPAGCAGARVPAAGQAGRAGAVCRQQPAVQDHPEPAASAVHAHEEHRALDRRVLCLRPGGACGRARACVCMFVCV